MEKEIDDIFLNESECITDKDKIDHLCQFSESIPRIYPHIQIIYDEIRSLRSHFSIYDVQLSVLAEDLQSIQEKNIAIEQRLEQEAAIYNSLRDLCIGLSIAPEHFANLENGLFTSVEDLARMEKSLAIISDFNLDSYNIRVVRERREEIETAGRNFLKRFLTFLSKHLIKSESTGELKVHRALYKSITQYNFIFDYSRRFEDYYSVLCSAYSQHAKRMYEEEFENHLNSVYDLIDNNDKLGLVIDVLLKSYTSLFGCEMNFMRVVNINTGPEEIFRDVDTAILEFMGEAFKKSKIITILELTEFLEKAGKNLENEYFKKQLERKRNDLADMFVSSEKEAKVTYEKIRALNELPREDCYLDFRTRLEDAYINRIMKSGEKDDIKTVINKTQLILSLESSTSLKKEAYDALVGKLTKMVISNVFGEGDSIDNTMAILKMVDTNIGGSGTVIKEIRSIVEENVEPDNRQGMTRLFTSQIINK